MHLIDIAATLVLLAAVTSYQMTSALDNGFLNLQSGITTDNMAAAIELLLRQKLEDSLAGMTFNFCISLSAVIASVTCTSYACYTLFYELS